MESIQASDSIHSKRGSIYESQTARETSMNDILSRYKRINMYEKQFVQRNSSNEDKFNIIANNYTQNYTKNIKQGFFKNYNFQRQELAKNQIRNIKNITARLNLGLSFAPGKNEDQLEEYQKSLEKQLSSSQFQMTQSRENLPLTDSIQSKDEPPIVNSINSNILYISKNSKPSYRDQQLSKIYAKRQKLISNTISPHNREKVFSSFSNTDDSIGFQDQSNPTTSRDGAFFDKRNLISTKYDNNKFLINTQKLHKPNHSLGTFKDLSINAPRLSARNTSIPCSRNIKSEISIPQRNSGNMLRKILKEEPDETYEKIKISKVVSFQEFQGGKREQKRQLFKEIAELRECGFGKYRMEKRVQPNSTIGYMELYKNRKK